MNKPTHTPGPWRIQWGRQEHYPLSIHNGAVNIVTSMGRKAAPDAVANAHLIAAAPDLLEALDGLVKNFDIDRQWHSAKGGDDYPDSLSIRQARHAIAKATGTP